MTSSRDNDSDRRPNVAAVPPSASIVPARAGPVARVAERLGALLETPLAAGLYLVATPIGNLADMTLRAIAVLARAGVVYCEDTRHTRTLLEAYGLSPTLRPYHEHNAASERPRILESLSAGQSIALVSDAGTPLVSDPGYKLVREAAAAGHAVFAIPGPSAVLAALVTAGLPTDAFQFAGFLPPRQSARRKRIEALASCPGTLVIFESPGRAADCLADLCAVLGPRPAALTRELTKRFEEITRAPLDALAADPRLANLKGEIVILVGAPEPGTADASDDDIRDHLRSALQVMSVRDAAREVAAALGIPRNRAYDLAVALRRQAQQPDD